MNVASINHLAVLAAAVVSWLFGAAYYGVLGQQWMAALGKTKEELMPTRRTVTRAISAH